MFDRPGKAWFAAKEYGYGSSLPIAWQGWVALAAFVIALISAVLLLSGALRIIVATICIAVFCFTCAVTTEGGWRWRWGEDD